MHLYLLPTVQQALAITLNFFGQYVVSKSSVLYQYSVIEHRDIYSITQHPYLHTYPVILEHQQRAKMHSLDVHVLLHIQYIGSQCIRYI